MFSLGIDYQKGNVLLHIDSFYDLKTFTMEIAGLTPQPMNPQMSIYSPDLHSEIWKYDFLIGRLLDYIKVRPTSLRLNLEKRMVMNVSIN